MLDFLEILKKEHTDDESIRAFTEIENQLRDKKYGLVWEEHSCGDGSIDVTGKGLTAEKVPYFRDFRAFERQRRRADLTVKSALSEHINCFGRRVE